MTDAPIGERAKDALGRHAWAEAYELLSAADADAAADSLDADGLELLAQASWWTGRLAAAIEARERSYAAFVKAGDPVSAALEAGLIAQDNLLRSAYPIANAWLNRAERQLAGIETSPAHGWLAAVRAFQASLDGDYDAALAASVRARDVAEQFGDRDLGALALSCEGLSRIHLGDVAQGLALVDEATVAAIGGEIEPATAGGVCCSTIEACAALGDWGRAAQWTEAQDRWCRREHINGFPGMCRVFRAGIKRLRGDWLAAESEARRAEAELDGFIPAAVGLALYEIGLIRLRRGDLSAAEETLERAHLLGRDPEPAWSLLLLARGQVDAASASIRRAIDDPDQRPSWWAHPASDLNRLVLLPAQAEIALAAGDLATARQAAEALAALADRFPSQQSKALVASTAGAVTVREGDHEGGVRLLRHAIELWTELAAPFEVAQARVSLADAYAGAGDADRARRELEAARDAFHRLGALPDARRVDVRLGSSGDTGGRPHSPRGDGVVRTFVFTDIVDSTPLAELVGDDAWQSLIRWHDDAIRSIVAEHGGEEIKAIGDGFFLAFDDADRGVEAAIAIQRRLDDHRRREGFAPAVRIGLHRAEARRAGMDYLGGAVNAASRIGAAASGGEILASMAAVEAVGRPVPVSGRRLAVLKGIAEPIEVATIEWR